ncbi:MAG: phosphatase PAP2 family protein [Chitinophagaceae bacterium]|nr:MAG: phosphatase PAP2 family protein [Chitinophagaceae bacterium]
MNSSVANHHKQKARHISMRLILIAGLFLLSLLVFSLIANEMVFEQEVQLDQKVFALLVPMQSPAFTGFMAGITFFGSAQFLLPAYLVVIGIFLFPKKFRKLSLDVAAVGIAGTAILFSLKSVFHRHRPPDPLVTHVLGFSFPSGHSFSSFTFYGLLIYLVWKLWPRSPWRWPVAILLFVFASLIGFSRVYLHVHYASDVIAGLLLSIVWLTLSFWLMGMLEDRAQEKQKSELNS